MYLNLVKKLALFYIKSYRIWLQIDILHKYFMGKKKRKICLGIFKLKFNFSPIENGEKQ